MRASALVPTERSTDLVPVGTLASASGGPGATTGEPSGGDSRLEPTLSPPHSLTDRAGARRRGPTLRQQLMPTTGSDAPMGCSTSILPVFYTSWLRDQQ